MTYQSISIFIDSQATIKALCANWFKSALALECWEKLNKISESNHIWLTWVPSHQDIMGKERADYLAKTGASKALLGAEPAIGTPQSHTKHIIKKLRNERFINHWQNLTSCRQARNCIRISAKNSTFLKNISRTRLKKYVGVTTGHYGFNKHLTTIGKRSDPGCDLCGFHTDSAEHFMCNCPAFINKRRLT